MQNKIEKQHLYIGIKKLNIQKYCQCDTKNNQPQKVNFLLLARYLLSKIPTPTRGNDFALM